MRKSVLFVLILLLVVTFASPASAQTTINTDGDVEAQGFIGDGSRVTDVDAQLLDSMDSSAFAQEMDLQTVERALVAILAQFPGLGKVPLARTGQTTCYEAAGAVTACGTGIGLAQDGDLQLGVSWPNPRLTDNGDGTVTDELTGLVWMEDADCFTSQNWTDALAKSNAVFDGCTDCGGTNNDCNLADGSVAGQWRLPNVRELHSLIDFGNAGPALPTGHPFDNVVGGHYWTSTTREGSGGQGYRVHLGVGFVESGTKVGNAWVWPVRGGQ